MTNPAETVAELKLTVESKFVPFTLSRNKNEKYKSLNWEVTLKRDGREVLTTDYSAGIAYCPGYKQGMRPTVHNMKTVEYEVETGKTARRIMSGGAIVAGKPIEPNAMDVIHSLVMDSDVLDSAGFEDWADDFGMDTDSRAAERMYRDCLELALKMRSAIGESGMEKLREAFQDY